MHSRRRLTLALLPLVVLAVIPMAALAATTQQLVTLAQSYAMPCAAIPSEVTCTRMLSLTTSWRAVIQPASGQETNLLTRSTLVGTVPAIGLDGTSRTGAAPDVHRMIRSGVSRPIPA